MDISSLCSDLLDERSDLFDMLEKLDELAWDIATPAPGWTIRDQVTHLAWFDENTRLAIRDPDGFKNIRAGITDIDQFVSDVTQTCRINFPGREALLWLRQTGSDLTDAALTIDAPTQIPWYGTEMSIPSAVTARIMETWAHGQDVADALGIERHLSPRMHHVAFIAWRAIPHSFRLHGLQPPADAIGIEADTVRLGPVDANNVIRGPLLDLCLVATQRRHPADTDLVAVGPDATQWLSIAQAFAGPPGVGRTAGQFRKDFR